MKRTDKIYVAGHNGLIGSAFVRELKKRKFAKIITSDLDLRIFQNVESIFKKHSPDYVILAAAKVGGIQANNSYPADFIRDNLCIQTNIIHQSYMSKVKKLLYLGSSCIFPKLCLQPIKEEYLLTGELEETNKAYAVAKIAGIEACMAYNKQYDTNFISVMPCNLYGINDKFHKTNSHVIPALITKLHEAKIKKLPAVELIGDGSAIREFLYVDDMVKACLIILKSYKDKNKIINIGSGNGMTISNLVNIVKDVVGYKGKIIFDGNAMLNGTPKKVLYTKRVRDLGWKPSIGISSGLTLVYDNYVKKTLSSSKGMN